MFSSMQKWKMVPSIAEAPKQQVVFVDEEVTHSQIARVALTQSTFSFVCLFVCLSEREREYKQGGEAEGKG